MSSTPNQLILISGASGFVASTVIGIFLERGYKVRGTVRSQETAEKVAQLHARFKHQLSFAVVKDIAAEGAFDEAVKDVDGVIHIASPFQMAVEDCERDLLLPAIRGTTSILQAVKANAPKVRRVVITSSFAAIVDMTHGARPDYVYTESDWNPVTFDKAKAADPATAYCASKALAEKAAFDFVSNEQPRFSITTICPPMIYGPLEHDVNDMSKLNTSAADFYRLMNGTSQEVPSTAFFAFVDVRDVAEAHFRAYESETAAGQRYLTVGGSFTYQEMTDILREKFPDLADRIPKAKEGSVDPDAYKVSSKKAETELGIQFRGLAQVTTDTAESLLQLERKIGGA